MDVYTMVINSTKIRLLGNIHVQSNFYSMVLNISKSEQHTCLHLKLLNFVPHLRVQVWAKFIIDEVQIAALKLYNILVRNFGSAHH